MSSWEAAAGRDAAEVAIAAGIGAVVILRHRENIGRLLRGLLRGEEATVA